MIHIIIVSAMTVLLSLGGGMVVWASDTDDSKLTIISPKKGAVIKGDSVIVQYRMPKTIQATHIHCYVDGEYQRGFKGVVKGLTPGPHEIKVVAANQDHESLVAEATVAIEVK